MLNYQISVNQMADFYRSTLSAKKRIIAQQIQPDQFKIQWYQLTKAKVKKSIELKGDLNPIYDGIKTLMNRTTVNKKQADDKRVSLEALERFVKVKLPNILHEIDYTIVKSKIKSFKYSNVEIIVAPEIILKAKLEGKYVFGGIKIHINKNKPFDLDQSRYVASTIYRFLNDVIIEKDDTVLPELCFSLDIFSGRMVSADKNHEAVFKEINEIIEELKQLWNKV